MRNTLVLSPDQFKKDLSNLKMHFLFNKTAEYLSIPSMVEVYWDEVENNLLGCWGNDGDRIIPLQDEYVDRYITLNEQEFERYTANIKEGVKARVLKTYPSLIREHHFSTLVNSYLSQSDCNHAVLSSTQIDMQRGVDLILLIENHPFSLSITKKDSNTDWDKIKEQRKKGIVNPSPIKVVMNEDNTREVGKGNNLLWLFKDRVAENLIEKCVDLI